MKKELIPHLEAIADIMNMTKINERYYKGEHGTLFKMTSFGFVIPNHEDLLNDNLHPNYISRSFSLQLYPYL